MSAAIVLADGGFSVDLFERSPRLGGRASSLMSRKLGVALDEGQHVLLGCCTNLIDFYERIGALDRIKFHRSYLFIDSGEQSVLSDSPLPEPLHLAPSLMRLSGFGLADKLRAPRLLKEAISFSGPDGPASEWLARTGQSREAVKNFWEPVLVGALNERLDLASARYAAMVIRQGMMVDRRGFRLGIPQVPLGELNGSIASEALEARGVRIHPNAIVTAVEPQDDRSITLHIGDGSVHTSDYAVVAVDEASSARLIGEFTDPDKQLKPVYVPIVTLYLWYRDSLGFPPACCIPGGFFHWCFERSNIDPKIPGMHTSLSLVASAAKEFIRSSNEEILKAGLQELKDAFGFGVPAPDLWTVVKLRDATFSPVVGCDDLRPTQSTSLPNLFLAGEWTKTGWPGTMEGAVRSGYQCAAEIMKHEGIECKLPVSDLGWKRHK